MSTRMQQRRGTAAQWISTNSGNGPILAAGEIGFESDTNKFKIGDGVNHWVDLTYFTDAASAIASITDLVDGAPDLLNTLNELAGALGDDPSFSTNISNLVNGLEQDLADHAGETTSVHGIADASLLATMAYVDDALGNATVDQSALAGDGIDWNADTEQFDIDSTVATKSHVSTEIGTHAGDTTSVHGIADTSLLVVQDDLSAHNSDTTSVHGIADTSTLATKTFAANLLLEATKTNISITGDIDGLTITAENGVADSDTDDLAEGTNHLYFTAERAQDAIGNLVGTGLTYTDATGEIAVDTTTIQVRVANVSNTEIGYLDGVTSSIQTQLDAKSTDLSSHASDTTNIHGIADTSLLATTANVATAKGEAIDAAALASESYTDTAIGALTKSSVGLGNVDNTSDLNKPISTATQTALDLKAPLDSPVFTGTVEGVNLELSGDLIVQGTTTTVNTSNISVSDALIYIAEDNPGNALDIGFVGNYNNGTYQHTGFVRDVSDNKWKLFTGVTDEPTTTVNFGQGSLDTLAVGAFEATSATIGDVSNTELQYLNGVSSAIQTQLDSKQAIVSGVSSTEIGYLDGVTSSIQTQLDAKQAVVSGVSDTEIGYLDGVTSAIQNQLNAKAASLATINAQTASYTLSLSDKDKVVELNVGSANTVTVPLDSSVDFPIGSQIDILQVGSGQTTVVATGGVTVNATPGLKLRTQWAGATLRKRAANTWVLVGDLTA
jgi:hypothetical protein